MQIKSRNGWIPALLKEGRNPPDTGLYVQSPGRGYDLAGNRRGSLALYRPP
jgi:hypothetical protein